MSSNSLLPSSASTTSVPTSVHPMLHHHHHVLPDYHPELVPVHHIVSGADLRLGPDVADMHSSGILDECLHSAGVLMDYSAGGYKSYDGYYYDDGQQQYAIPPGGHPTDPPQRPSPQPSRATKNGGGGSAASNSKKRGIFPKQATNILRAWLFQHLTVS